MRFQMLYCFLFLVLLLVALHWFYFAINGQLGSRERRGSQLTSQPQAGIPNSTLDVALATPTRKKVSAKLAPFGSVCHTPECISVYESVLYGNTRIPTIRHILWKTDRVSSYFAKQLKSWNAIHPNWKYVLWRDSDLEKFVAKHYTGVLSKFKSLKHNIMRIDMIRYLILYHFGGVYADLDYVLVRPLDRFTKFPAVVTRETEAHAFFHYGMNTYPPPLLGNPAFMMSEPRHPFFHFSILQLAGKNTDSVFHFAGPLGLSHLIEQYARDFPLAENPDGVLFVPASRNFYSFEGNSLVKGTSVYKSGIVGRLRALCEGIKNSSSVAKNLTAYCRDVNNLDPITDRNETEYAIHDYNKPRSSHDSAGSDVFYQNPVDIRSVLPNVVMADSIF